MTKNTKPSRDKSTLLESTLLRIYFFGIYSFGIYSFKTLNNSWATANNYIITKTIFFLWNTSLKNSILESSIFWIISFYRLSTFLLYSFFTQFLPNFSLDSSLTLYYKHIFKLNSIYLWIPLWNSTYTFWILKKKKFLLLNEYISLTLYSIIYLSEWIYSILDKNYNIINWTNVLFIR